MKGTGIYVCARVCVCVCTFVSVRACVCMWETERVRAYVQFHELQIHAIYTYHCTHLQSPFFSFTSNQLASSS